MIKFDDIYFVPILKFHTITVLGREVGQNVRRKSRPFLHTFKKDIDRRSCLLKPKTDRKENIESDGKFNGDVATASSKPTSIHSNNATGFSIQVKNCSGGLEIQKIHSMGNLHGKSARKKVPNKGMHIETGMNVNENRQRVEIMATIKDTCNDKKKPAISRINKEECEEGECSSSSDDEIIVLDADGEELQTEEPRSGYSSYEKNENEIKHRLLCQFHKITITDHDYETLKEDNYLNDTIIDFYLTYLYESFLSKSMKEDVHIFSSHFYSRLKGSLFNEKTSNPTLRQSKSQTAYQRVKSWTRKLDIFSKRMLLFPICEEDHWYLIIVCNPGIIDVKDQITAGVSTGRRLEKEVAPSILLFDSLGLTQPSAVSKIRSYLYYEYLERKGVGLSFGRDKLKLHNLSVPLQPNECDCGLYLLHYVELIFEDPDRFLDKSLPNLSQWFKSEVIIKKRKFISSVIQRLSSKYTNNQSTEPEKNIPPTTSPKQHSSSKSSLKSSDRRVVIVDEPDNKSYNSKSPKEDLEEPCMLFRSPPRTLDSEREEDESPFKHDLLSNSKYNMLQDRLRHDNTNSYDDSDNMRYFPSGSRPGIAARIAQAFSYQNDKNERKFGGNNLEIVEDQRRSGQIRSTHTTNDDKRKMTKSNDSPRKRKAAEISTDGSSRRIVTICKTSIQDKVSFCVGYL